MAETAGIAVRDSLEVNTSELIEKYLVLKTENVPSPTRWRVITTQMFRSFSSVFARYLASRDQTDEVEDIYTYASSFIRRFKGWDSIENDSDLQDIFILGYLYSLKGLYEKADEMGDDKQEKQLLYALRAYRHVKPCLDALNNDVRLSHSDLAAQLSISPTSLSNFMSRVSEYSLFTSSSVGRKRYYALAYPNGEKALSLAREPEAPELSAPGSTLGAVLACLRQIAREEVDVDAALKNCSTIVAKNEPQTDLIAEQLQNIIATLRSPRIRMPDLLDFERRVDSFVVIYTISIDSEKDANETVIENLTNGRAYYYLVNETQGKKEEIKSTLRECLETVAGFRESFWDQIEIIVTAQDCDFCPDVSEIVIHDGKRVFVSEDKAINRETFYTETEGERGQEIKAKVLRLIPGFGLSKPLEAV